MMWFDKQDARALFIDNRRAEYAIDMGTPGTVGRSPIVIDPDDLADFTALPFPDASFHLVVFDPPHIERNEPLGFLTQKYGILKGDWREMIRKGFAECFRVLKPNGTLVFKWTELKHPVQEILKLTPERPLFGHKSSKTTRWCVFMKEATHEPPASRIDCNSCGTQLPSADVQVGARLCNACATLGEIDGR